MSHMPQKSVAQAIANRCSNGAVHVRCTGAVVARHMQTGTTGVAVYGVCEGVRRCGRRDVVWCGVVWCGGTGVAGCGRTHGGSAGSVEMWGMWGCCSIPCGAGSAEKCGKCGSVQQGEGKGREGKGREKMWKKEKSFTLFFCVKDFSRLCEVL